MAGSDSDEPFGNIESETWTRNPHQRAPRSRSRGRRRRDARLGKPRNAARDHRAVLAKRPPYDQPGKRPTSNSYERGSVLLPPPENSMMGSYRQALGSHPRPRPAERPHVHTNHWNDRELYEHLWNETLHEFTMDFPPGSGWNCHIDFLSSGSDEDNYLYLKYYADEQCREQWQKDFPDEVIPPHVDPPYDRDSKLPKSTGY